jgi:hypothetical protein
MTMKTLPIQAEGYFVESSLPLSAEALAQAKFGFTTRRVCLADLVMLVYGSITPRAGDLVLAKIVKVGEHSRIQWPSGRRAMLFPGDEIVVAYGNRYAPDQFEAIVPDSLSECHLVASGGVAGKVLSRHGGLKSPTVIKPIGLLGDAYGKPINLDRYRLPKVHSVQKRATIIAVAGTSMNAGKTTAAAHLIKGLVRAGCRVAAVKITGTGAGNDLWMYQDAGAAPTLDFTDVGHASTYRASSLEILECFTTLLAHAQVPGITHVVLEVADGLLQRETASLLQSSAYRNMVDGTIFCASDALGAAAGVEWLEQRAVGVLAVSGVVSASPLGSTEARNATRLPVFTREELADAEVAVTIAQSR